MEPDEADLVLRAVDRARKVRAEQAAQVGGDVSAETSSRSDHHVSGSAGERFQVVVHLDQEVLAAEGAWSATLEDGTRPDYELAVSRLLEAGCDVP